MSFPTPEEALEYSTIVQDTATAGWNAMAEKLSSVKEGKERWLFMGRAINLLFSFFFSAALKSSNETIEKAQCEEAKE